MVGLGLVSGFVSFFATVTLVFGGIAGGDFWHHDWTAKLWWVVPILFLGMDFFILSLIQKFSIIDFQRISYVVLTVVYILSMIATFYIFLAGK